MLPVEYDVVLNWRPFMIELEAAYGGTVEERTERDWRKVRYLYMDARRLAARRGITIRGPLKIYDSTTAHIGMLVALSTSDAVFRRYHEMTGERFWLRQLEIEDPAAIRQVLVEAGADGRVFDDLVSSGEGARQCRTIIDAAEERGVFGVPSFVIDDTGEIFWGNDRVWMLTERLTELLRAPVGQAVGGGVVSDCVGIRRRGLR